jgi:hypothetical protein
MNPKTHKLEHRLYFVCQLCGYERRLESPKAVLLSCPACRDGKGFNSIVYAEYKYGCST